MNRIVGRIAEGIDDSSVDRTVEITVVAAVDGAVDAAVEKAAEGICPKMSQILNELKMLHFLGCLSNSERLIEIELLRSILVLNSLKLGE